MKKGLAAEFRQRRVVVGVQKIEDKIVATLKLHRVPAMTEEGRRSVAEWLRKQAALIETDGTKIAPSYTARYFAR